MFNHPPAICQISNRGRRLVPLNLPIQEVNHPLGVARKVRFVGHEDNGVTLPRERFELRHDLPTSSRVQVARRFVGQQDRRTIHQSSTDGDSLAAWT